MAPSPGTDLSLRGEVKQKKGGGMNHRPVIREKTGAA
jgi:hypothetical protein